MDLDPHTLNQIIQKIQQQMRCPQCGGKVPVNIPAVRMTGDDFLLLQLKCGGCDAYIVLHASLQGGKQVRATLDLPAGVNVSSSLNVTGDEMEALRTALAERGGSFSSLFADNEPKPDQTSA